MRITLKQNKEEPEEVVIKYHEMNREIQSIVDFIEKKENHLLVWRDGLQYQIAMESIIYFESVDGETYVYQEKEVYRSRLTLENAERLYEEQGFFRCSKSMVINIYRIHSLKSESGNRIDATMDNGEHVMISRRFSKELRRRLRGGAE